MTVCLIGISHQTASVPIREQFFLRPDQRELLLSELKNDPRIVSAIVLSTCNRTEIYAQTISPRPDLLLNALLSLKKIPLTPDLKEHFYQFSEENGLRHLLNVSCGLDSLVIGEKQVLGQVKEAVELSRSKGMMSREFNILAQIAIRAGKKAQSETAISCGGSSVSWAAVATAGKMLGSLQDKTVLIVGAGKMSQLTASQLNRKNVGRVLVMNRTVEKARALAAQVNGQAVSFWEIKDVLDEVDVCICSAGAPHYLIEKDLVETVISRKKNPELLFIDISTPRNINPQVAGVCGATLITIDQLDKVVKDNVARRQGSVAEVKSMIEDKIIEYYRKLDKVRQYHLSTRAVTFP